MSSWLAIAAVTATIRSLLEQGLNADVAGTTVTTRPPDKARNGTSGSQVNLFLYHTVLSSGRRNMDVPQRVRAGETGYPPLPLNLHYLVTVYYGDNEDDIDTATDANRLLGSHRLLGRAMSILHDHPLLGPADINAILPPGDRLDNPYEEVESVRITPDPLSLDDVSKLWAGFQTQYRMSTTYEASVVLINSSRPTAAALPVLRRGSDDRGSYVLPSPSPDLFDLRIPNQKPAAEPGDVLTVVGYHLDAEDLTVRFGSALLTDPMELTPLPGGTGNELRVKLPDTTDDPQVPARWPPGFYTLSVVIQHPGLPRWVTNALPFALAPLVSGIDPLAATQGDLPLTLTVTCTPQVRAEQRVVLLLGHREIAAQSVTTPADPTAATTLTFLLETADPGEYVLRLRVDGVDSIPVDFTAVPPEFAPNQKVTIT